MQKVVPTVLTGGLNLVPGVKKVIAPVTKAITKLAPVLVPKPTQVLTALATRNPLALLPAAPANSGGPMALNLGGILSQVGGILGGNQNQIFQTASNVANLASQFFPQPTATQLPVVQTAPRAMTTAAAMPAIRGGMMVARGFFNKFPNLALAIQQLRARGMTVKRSQLWTMLKRFGPEVLIGGGLLTAGAVSELMVAGPGHRRMNPANVKALRRSMRRLDSFHRLCVTADRLRRPRSRGKSKSGSGSTHFVRQG